MLYHPMLLHLIEPSSRPNPKPQISNPRQLQEYIHDFPLDFVTIFTLLYHYQLCLSIFLPAARSSLVGRRIRQPRLSFPFRYRTSSKGLTQRLLYPTAVCMLSSSNTCLFFFLGVYLFGRTSEWYDSVHRRRCSPLSSRKR